jgi:hypothetical protein
MPPTLAPTEAPTQAPTEAPTLPPSNASENCSCPTPSGGAQNNTPPAGYDCYKNRTKRHACRRIPAENETINNCTVIIIPTLAPEVPTPSQNVPSGNESCECNNTIPPSNETQCTAENTPNKYYNAAQDCNWVFDQVSYTF